MSRLPSRLWTIAGLVVAIASLGIDPSEGSMSGRSAPLFTASLSPSHASPLARSRYLAGYRVSDPAHPYEVIIKAVDVPNVSCSDSDFEGVAIGAGSEPVLGLVEYFSGVFVTCVSGQAQYLMETRVGDQEQATGIEPGDQAQIVISLHCDEYPTCSIFVDATSLDSDVSVSVQRTIDVTTDSALFGAFPLFDGSSTKPAPVPDFANVRVLGCLFDNHLIRNRSAERITRSQHGTVQIKATKIDVGSFRLKHPN